MSYYENALRKRASIRTATGYLTDEQAVEVKELYDSYDELVEEHKTVEQGFRFFCDDKLWKTRQPRHTFDGQYRPGDPGTESLYEEIGKPGEGTHDNPIHYNNNMALEEGLFYTQFDVLYYCFRDTGAPVFNNLQDLIGLYVRVSNE